MSSAPRPEGPAPLPPGAIQTSAEDLALGLIAVERGILRQDQLDAGLREQVAAHQRGEITQLCQILIRQGTMTTDDLVRLVREQSHRAEGLPAIPRYDIQARLGEGATAVVYRAWDRELRRTVALKILRESAGFSEIGRQRFRREAQAAAGLSHPNVITVHDAGETDGRLYLVMEFIEGKPLNEFLRNPALELRDRVRLIEGIARGVAAAHAKGIVHRDLKPANILVTAGGEPKVADFGLAHMVDSTTALTRTGSALGTPLYMSPEQVSGKVRDITPCTDVWALGAILYEVLSGTAPFPGDTQLEIYEKISRQDPPTLRQTADAIVRDLETIAHKALQKDPAKRYPSASELGDDLRRVLGGETILARRPTLLETIWRRLARRRALVGVAALLLGSTGWVVVQQWRYASRVRGALTRAQEDERQGRLQEARDGYLLVRQLEPSNVEASIGLQRAEEVLEHRRRELVEQSRAREEAVRSIKPASIEWTHGDVKVLGERTRDVAKTGQELHPGYGLETVGAESFTRVNYLNVVMMDLDANTLIEQSLGEPVSGGPKAVFVKKGALRVTVASVPPGKPLLWSTPQLEVQAAPALFRLMVSPQSTRLVVESGALEARRRTDGFSMQIKQGFALECDGSGAMAAQPTSAPGGRLLADFDSHGDLDWIPAGQSKNAILSRSVIHPGLQGSGALHLEYSVPASEMVWITNSFAAPQDWSAHPGISFWFKGTRSRSEIIVELWENRDPAIRAFESERWWYTFKDDFVGWRKFEVPWTQFKRRPFPGTPDDGFTLKEMWGVTIIIPGNDRAREGRCEFDQIELLPPAAERSGKPWQKLFDGTATEVFVPYDRDVWRLLEGAMISDAAAQNEEVLQTVKPFAEGEIRIRFDILKDLDRFHFAIRQGSEGRHLVHWSNNQVHDLKGRPHELVFACRGEDVSASLDGHAVPIEQVGRPKEGRLQISALGSGLRILAIDYR